VAYYFATGMNAGQTDGTDARDACIRQALDRLAAQGLRGEAFTARLLAIAEKRPRLGKVKRSTTAGDLWREAYTKRSYRQKSIAWASFRCGKP